MEKLVVINLDDNEYRKVKNIAGRMKLAVERINCTESEGYGITLETLASGKYGGKLQPAEQLQSDGQSGSGLKKESLILLCGLRDKRLDKVLFELRRSDTAVDFKAVLTPTNKDWTLRKLFAELGRERKVMNGQIF